MIRLVTTTAHGVLIILGVIGTNLDRLRAGQPVHVDLGRLLRDGLEPGVQDGRLELAICFGETHAAIVLDLREAGVPMPEHALNAAIELDEQLSDEAPE